LLLLMLVVLSLNLLVLKMKLLPIHQGAGDDCS
jgi:hypothetical protein